MKLVKCEEKHWKFILTLRNHPEVKKGFVDQSHIDWLTHKKFMETWSDRYWICLDDTDEPIGFIGDVKGDIRVAVSLEHQGRGVGKFMMREYIRLTQGLGQAKVKIDNEASIRLFETAGFKKKFYILEYEA
jgi:RimJ/RimL family protein N-acetyltransferase